MMQMNVTEALGHVALRRLENLSAESLHLGDELAQRSGVLVLLEILLNSFVFAIT
jgi:hypothetical protein